MTIWCNGFTMPLEVNCDALQFLWEAIHLILKYKSHLQRQRNVITRPVKQNLSEGGVQCKIEMNEIGRGSKEKYFSAQAVTALDLQNVF